MRTITKEVQLYKYEELSDTAKERVKEWRNQDGHAWGDESIASLKAFAAQFGVKVTDLCYSPWGNADISTDATPANFRGFTLTQARALPEYLTGYYLDATLYGVFVREFEQTGDAFHAFNKAMDAGIKEARDDWEYQFSDEYMQDACDANEYEFTADGRIVR